MFIFAMSLKILLLLNCSTKASEKIWYGKILGNFLLLRNL
jgi:hypothetical protein